MKYFSLIILLALAAVSIDAAKITNTTELIGAMNKKYAGKWYRTLTFAQNTASYKPDGTVEKSVWYETMALPGKLRIDFERIGSGNGAIFDNGTQHDFRGGKIVGSRRNPHLLLILGFDVYGQSPAVTIKQLEEMKFDLTKFREDSLDGRAAYVVGADKGDLRSRQFWIDKKNLYFLRSIQPTGKNGERTQEIRFSDYRPVKGGGWVGARVDFLTDGKLVFLEEYFDIKPNVKLADGIFDPKNLGISSYTP